MLTRLFHGLSCTHSVLLILLFDSLTLLLSCAEQGTTTVNIIYSCSLAVNQRKHLATLLYLTNALCFVFLIKKNYKKYSRKTQK